jgi:hypothetical protein
MRASTAVSDYVVHNRTLGKRYLSEAILLAAFTRSVGDRGLDRITQAMITAFVNHGEVRDNTSSPFSHSREPASRRAERIRQERAEKRSLAYC